MTRNEQETIAFELARILMDKVELNKDRITIAKLTVHMLQVIEQMVNG